jgi:tetratricopeptide (TPR) repeat protein
MKKIILLLISTVYLAGMSYGQDFTSISEAFTRSYSFEKEGKYTEAAKELTQVYDKTSYEINVRLGWLAYEAGSYIESMKYYDLAIALKPFAIEPRFGYVSSASSTGNWNQVEEQYKKIISIDPMNTKANYYMGLICYNREEYEEAMKYFEIVANLFPFDYDSTIMYAWTNYKLHNLREAKILFQKALLITPDDSSALEGLSMIQ